MADRSAAEVFRIIFEELAKNPTDDHKSIARVVYQETRKFDFEPRQMDADEACLRLGLAQRGVDPDYLQDGETTLWPGDSGYSDAPASSPSPAPVYKSSVLSSSNPVRDEDPDCPLSRFLAGDREHTDVLLHVITALDDSLAACNQLNRAWSVLMSRKGW